MVRIIADSTCDISKEDAKKLGIEIIPITVRFGEEEFLDGVEITHEEFYKRLAECEELPKTSQPSPDRFMDVFMRYVNQGDDVIGIFISSELSGTYQSACIAAADVEEESGKKIFIVDSRNASIGTALLIREAVKYRDNNMSAEEIADACRELAGHIKLTAVVGSLKYLKMGGRLSGAQAFAGTMLHITPVVSIEDGKVVVIGKTRGKKAAEKLMHEKLSEDGISLSRDFVFGHINCPDSLETFINKSLSHISDVRGKVCVSSIGCSVGTHVGPGTYGIAYVEDSEEGMNSDSVVKTA